MTHEFESLPSNIRSQIIRSRVPYRFREVDLADLDTYSGKAKDTIDHWLDLMVTGQVVVASGKLHTCGKGLFIQGPPGTGKTFLASVAALTALQTMPQSKWRERWLTLHRDAYPHPVMYFTYPEILASLKRGWDRKNGDEDRALMDSVFGHGPDADKVRLLVIDDLGKEHAGLTEWAEHTFDHLLRERFDAGLPTIVTSNLTKAEIGTRYGDAMGSFMNDAFFPITLEYGSIGDRREKAVAIA